MSEVKTFFRFCPGCGRRFHIKLESKKLVNVERESVEVKRAVSLRAGYPFGSSTPTTVQEGEPIIIDVEEFQYTYICKHCGHEWSEKHVEESKG